MIWNVRLIKPVIPPELKIVYVFKQDIKLPFVPYPDLIYYDGRENGDLEENIESVIWLAGEKIFEAHCESIESVDPLEVISAHLLEFGWEPYEDEDDLPSKLDERLIS